MIKPSAVNFDLHPGIEIVVLMGHFAILAVQTLALFSTFFACSKTLAIVFAALRFFASALFHRDKSWHSFKTARMSVVGHLLSLVYGHLTPLLVAATTTQAFLVA